MKTKTPSAPKSLIHLTLNSGDSRHSPRSEVRNSIVGMLAPFVNQTGVPPILPWDIAMRVDAANQFAVFFISKRRIPLLTCYLAFGADDRLAWDVTSGNYASCPILMPGSKPSGSIIKPAGTPWLAVMLYAGLHSIPLEEVFMFGDFERCLAWTIIEQHSKR